MSNLVILFPGIGYTCDKPLLYYGRKIAFESGYNDCHLIKFEKIDKTGLQDNPDKMMKIFNKLFVFQVVRLFSIKGGNKNLKELFLMFVAPVELL